MTLDGFLSTCGIAAEAALLLLLLRFRVYRSLPAFFVYSCWNLISDVGLFFLRSEPSPVYFRIYEIQLVLDSAMMFAVLVELAWSVLRPVRDSLPRRSWIIIAIIIVFCGFMLWPLAGWAVPAYLSSAGANFFRLQQTFAILRVLIFLGMAGLSQLLSIGWRNRELQIATGLGFYSIVALSVSVAHVHQAAGTKIYHLLDNLAAASYLGSLVYWVIAFTTKEAVRQDFSPQMENFLLLIGGSAKSHRVALRDFPVTKPREKDHR